MGSLLLYTPRSVVVKMKIDLKNKKTIGAIVAVIAAVTGAVFMGSGLTVVISTCEAPEAPTSAPSVEDAETPTEPPETPPEATEED